MSYEYSERIRIQKIDWRALLTCIINNLLENVVRTASFGTKFAIYIYTYSGYTVYSYQADPSNGAQADPLNGAKLTP